MPIMPTASLPTVPDERDVIRAPRQLGFAAMSILGTRAGADVEDPMRPALLRPPPERRTRGT